MQGSYTWDQNANLTSLNDMRSAAFQVRTRSMSCDARNRLWTTTYGYNGRVATFGDEVLDNLSTTSDSSRSAQPPSDFHAASAAVRVSPRSTSGAG